MVHQLRRQLDRSHHYTTLREGPPTSGPAGSAVTVSGGSFAASETITVNYETLLSTPKPSTVTLCTATATLEGTFSCLGAIPSHHHGPLGNHKIVAEGATPDAVATTVFKLTP